MYKEHIIPSISPRPLFLPTTIDHLKDPPRHDAPHANATQTPKVLVKMVIQTRSAARRAQDIGSAIPQREGTLVTIEPSATGLGVHKRWHYPDAAAPRIRDESFSSSSSSSLSSLSSSRDWGSTLSSLSSMESIAPLELDQLRDVQQENRAPKHPSHPTPPETPRPIPGAHKRTPLRRSPLIRWTTDHDGTTRRLLVPNVPYSQDDARVARMMKEKEDAATKKMDEVFEKQYAMMLRQRERAVLSMTRSDDDMDDESVESFESSDGSMGGSARPLVRGDTHPALDAPSFASGSDYDPFLVNAYVRNGNDTHMVDGSS
ncbi:hypothetical protein PLEOSDRAFT_163235 [Pleurotus ostreatus PC15]|uniref:Uncharacterized protein n=1 Tax=Pleurotus ostreatus (strain PC15) TaxID=1137138 RepID=A0A067N3E2_PLEO1|nr:hypothetical protein PLEOSDRAFT_163235 [Pleurotus ostreatus PC15]